MPDMKIMTVTPEMADEWLKKKNKHNRKMRKRYVNQIANAITNGEWELTYDPIRFNGDGTLTDGQHRLAGCVQAGRPIITLVVTGLPTSTQTVIDTNTRRTHSDALTLRGESNCTALASALSYLHMYRVNGSPARAVATTKQALALLDANPDIRVSVTFVGMVRALRYPQGMAAALHYIFSEIDRDDADDFWTAFAQGVNLQPGDPILLLRRRMEANANATTKLPRATIWALTVKAWNHWRNGAEIRALRWRRSGPNGENIPRPE